MQSQRQRFHVQGRRQQHAQRVGHGSAPSTISVRTGSTGGWHDRVELTWTDGSITQEWLEVTVHADANTGLSSTLHFLLGSLIANSGTGDTGAMAITSSTDENAVRIHIGTATVTNVFDFNKDGFVNSSDENTARDNGARIKFIKIAANTPLAPDASPSVTPDVSVDPAVTTGAPPPAAATRALPAAWPVYSAVSSPEHFPRCGSTGSRSS